MTDPKPMSDARLATLETEWSIEKIGASGFDPVDAIDDIREALAEVRRLHARERELHNRIRLEFVQDGSKLDWWVCQECGKTGPNPERHAFVNGKPCLAAPLPKEDEELAPTENPASTATCSGSMERVGTGTTCTIRNNATTQTQAQSDSGPSLSNPSRPRTRWRSWRMRSCKC